MDLLADSDRTTVRRALDEIREEPLPPDRASLGCALALPAFAILLVFPVVGRMLRVGSGVAAAVLGIGFALLVVGLGLWFFAGGRARRHATAAAEAALRHLEGTEGDRESVVRAATLLLANAFARQGPARYATFDVEEARRRLGDQLGLVTLVERFLLEEEAIYPVFTSASSADAED